MRKAAVLLLVFTVIISAALITIQRKIDGENSFAVIKESMGEYEYGEDMLYSLRRVFAKVDFFAAKKIKVTKIGFSEA